MPGKAGTESGFWCQWVEELRLGLVVLIGGFGDIVMIIPHPQTADHGFMIFRLLHSVLSEGHFLHAVIQSQSQPLLLG